MEIKFKITEKDYASFIHMDKRRWSGGIDFIGILFAVIAVIGIVLYSIPFYSTDLNLYNSGAILLLSAMVFLGSRAYSSYQLTQNFKNNVLFQEEITISFNTTGINQSIPNAHTYSDWDKILKVQQSKNIIAVYISPIQAYIIPKSQLNEEKKREIFEIFKTHLNNTTFKEVKIA